MKSHEKTGRRSKKRANNVSFYPVNTERPSEPLPRSIKSCNNGQSESLALWRYKVSLSVIAV